MSENPFASPAGDENPYASPSEAGTSSGNPLLPPAIILLTLSSLMLLLLLITLPVAIMTALELAKMSQEMSEPQVNGFMASYYFFGWIGAFVVMAVGHVAVIVGSINMIRLKGYASAMTAAIISVIPLCSAFYVLGIPFGIWAIVLLSRLSVKQKFR